MSSGTADNTPTGDRAAASGQTSLEAAASGGRVTELISRLLFMRGHSVHALQFASIGAPAGSSENPVRRMFFTKTLV